MSSLVLSSFLPRRACVNLYPRCVHFQLLSFPKGTCKGSDGLPVWHSTQCRNTEDWRFVVRWLAARAVAGPAFRPTCHATWCKRPTPQTSSGARALRVNKLPYFVGMHGVEKVELENGAWEMVWRNKNPSGCLICGFDVPHEVRHKPVLFCCSCNELKSEFFLLTLFDTRLSGGTQPG